MLSGGVRFSFYMYSLALEASHATYARFIYGDLSDFR